MTKGEVPEGDKMKLSRAQAKESKVGGKMQGEVTKFFCDVAFMQD